jgi:hypothetical protein
MRRIIPAVLASIGFLATFSFRSWDADLWPFSEATDRPSVSVPRQPTTVRGISSASRLAVQPARRHEPPMPAVRSMTTIADAPHFSSERDREENHSARMR